MNSRILDSLADRYFDGSHELETNVHEMSSCCRNAIMPWGVLLFPHYTHCGARLRPEELKAVSAGCRNLFIHLPDDPDSTHAAGSVFGEQEPRSQHTNDWELVFKVLQHVKTLTISVDWIHPGSKSTNIPRELAAIREALDRSDLGELTTLQLAPFNVEHLESLFSQYCRGAIWKLRSVEAEFWFRGAPVLSGRRRQRMYDTVTSWREALMGVTDVRIHWLALGHRLRAEFSKTS